MNIYRQPFVRAEVFTGALTLLAKDKNDVNTLQNLYTLCGSVCETCEEATALYNSLAKILKRQDQSDPNLLDVDAAKKVIANVYDGTNKIRTIKEVREATGWPLKVAKSFVENYLNDNTN